MPGLDDVLCKELGRMEEAGLRRQLRRWEGVQGPWLDLDGRRLSSFSSNNYLGLAGHPALRRAAISALERAGVGSAAARLISGNHEHHEALEVVLARFHCADAALLFNSGYQANVGIIPAVVERGDLLLSDRLNHASLIDGARLSRATVFIYDHADAAHARAILLANRRSFRRCLIATESVFSMDGDVAPLAELAALAIEHDAWLMVDEAHAVGALGPGGRGICAQLGVDPDILVGTLGKAFGAFGAYAIGSSALRAFLLHRARSFVFSTALPPSVAAAARAALSIITGPDGERLRGQLGAHIDHVRSRLASLHLLAPRAGSTPIFPIHIGDETTALAVSHRLFSASIHAQAIRPPTVPRGTSRLRFTLMSLHTPPQLDHILTELADLSRTFRLPCP